MAAQDPVRNFLREKGCGEHIVERGLEGLVEKWEDVVQSVEEGYSLGLDDYLNDMDARQLIEESLVVATPPRRERFVERVNRADELMKGLVEPARRCLWGAEIAEEEGWTTQENWWYFSRPINAGQELLDEIDEAMEDR
jgi:hypothetical protein